MSYADVICAETLSPHKCNDAGLGPISQASCIAQLAKDFSHMHRKRNRGDYLFHVGDSFHSLYVLNAGFAKTCRSSVDGREQTMGLHLRGDILGLEAISSGMHGCDAVALDTCDVLALPFEMVLERSQRSLALMRELMHALSAEIHADRALMGNIRSLPAMGRVAAFLLDISARFAARGFSATQIQLRLSRQEIGSILGLKLETVSRVFSHLAQLGLLSVYLRDIVLLDRDQLRDLIAQPTLPKQRRQIHYYGNLQGHRHEFARVAACD